MNEKYLRLAEAHEALAACYRDMAGSKEQKAAPNNVSTVAQVDQNPAPKVSIETVRAVLAQKNLEGKKDQVKALLLKYDSGKLSGVKPEDYPALLADAEAL